MGWKIALSAGLLVSIAQTAWAERCRPESATDPKLYATDMKWGQPLEELVTRYEHLYQSGKRLPQRAYRDSDGRYYLPYHVGDAKTVEITSHFIEAVTTHIEKALIRKYADAIYFSDMGHAHMLVPLEKYAREYSDIPAARLNEFYTKAFQDPEIRFLYHTAEQMDFSSQEHHIVWRRHTRNLVGENKPGGEVHVEPAYHEIGFTLRDVEGYHWFSAAFNLSASKDGCFPFKTPTGEIRYFDLSLYDLDYPATLDLFRWDHLLTRF